jgi:elongation factor G
MQVDSSEQIRNVAIAGHNDTGKTTLTSALLYTSGVVNRLNKVEDGNTTTDFDAEEIHRGISIGLATCFAPWREHKVNLLDCPGYGIFFTETRAGMRAADSVLLCVNSVSGIEVTTEKAWALAKQEATPVMVHLTKMDRERADFERIVDKLHEALDRRVMPVQLPLGRDGEFEGVVDLMTDTAWSFAKDGDGKGSQVEIPADLVEHVEKWRNQLIEAVAESDDALLEKFFENGTLGPEELEKGLHKAVRARRLFPLTLSSGLHGIGISTLLDDIVNLLPNPTERGTFPATDIGNQPIGAETSAAAPASVLVFKTLSDPFSGKVSLLRVVSGEVPSDSMLWNTAEEKEERIGHLLEMQGKQGKETPKLITGDIGGVAKLKTAHTGQTLCAKDKPIKLAWIEIREPAISFAIEPKSKGDEEKIGEAIHRLMEEDPSLRTHRDSETGEFLLSGSGQLHVEIAVAKLKQRFQVEVILHPPRVPYRETLRRKAPGHGRHKKQTGGRGQFADCRITIEPLTRGEDFEFVDEIFGGSIPQGYRPAVEKGIQEARLRGYLAGYPVVDFRVRLQDGQYHDVDSSEMAFKIAGSLAFKDAMSKAGPTIIEPLMKVEINTSDEFTGDIMSDLSQRRGKPQGMDSRNAMQVIQAVVPMSEMLDYAPALRSMTQGRATFHAEFSHYEEVPKSFQEKLIAEAKAAKEAEE